MAPQSEVRTAIVTEAATWPINGVEGKEGRITVEYPPGVHAPHTAIRAGSSSTSSRGRSFPRWKGRRRENTKLARRGRRRAITHTCTSAATARTPGRRFWSFTSPSQP